MFFISSCDLSSDYISSYDIYSDDISSDDISSGELSSDDISSGDISSGDISSDDISSDGISSRGTTEIDLVLLCLSLAATSQMHAHDVCVLSLLRLWNCGPIDAIAEIKNETVWRSLKWNLGSRCARLAFCRLQSVGPFWFDNMGSMGFVHSSEI